MQYLHVYLHITSAMKCNVDDVPPVCVCVCVCVCTYVYLCVKHGPRCQFARKHLHVLLPMDMCIRMGLHFALSITYSISDTQIDPNSSAIGFKIVDHSMEQVTATRKQQVLRQNCRLQNKATGCGEHMRGSALKKNVLTKVGAT